MKTVLYLLLVASLSSKAPGSNPGTSSLEMVGQDNQQPEAVPLNSETRSEHLAINAQNQPNNFKLDDYKICYRDGSIVKVGSLTFSDDDDAGKEKLKIITQKWEQKFGKIFATPDQNFNPFLEIFLESESNLLEIFENLKSDLAPSTAARFAFFLLYACNYDYELPNFTELQKNIESYLRNVYSRDDMTLKLKWFEQQRLSIMVFVSSACLLFDAIPSLAISLSTSPSHVNATSSMDGSITISCLPDNETNTSLCSGKFFGNQTFTFSAIPCPTPGINPWKIIAACGLLTQFIFPWFVNILFAYCNTPITDDDDEIIKSASYLLAAYIICKDTKSNKGWKDKFASEDFPCQVAIRNAAYSCKKSKTGDLSKLIIESLERMKK